MNEFTEQAQQFLDEAKVQFKVKLLGPIKFFCEPTQARHVFKVTFRRGQKYFTVKFKQSVASGDTHPTPYDVLSCLTKHNPHRFKDFCADYGYDTDSRKAYDAYKEVVKEWEKVSSFFSEAELKQLQEIY
jgi:hypothetical protein